MNLLISGAALLLVAAALFGGISIGQGLTVGAALAIVCACAALQVRYEIIKWHRAKPDSAEMGALEARIAEMAEESVRAQLATKAQRLTHLEQLDRYLEDRRLQRDAKAKTAGQQPT